MSERLEDIPASPLLEKRKGGNMDRRLIDANALMDEIKNRCIMPEWCKTLVRSIVIDLPTIEERKTGKWIPCSEQEYPSDNREVEVTCEFTRCNGKKVRYTCHASYVHRYSIASTPYNDWEDCEEYNEEKDMYYALPGWYERVHNWDDYSYCAIEGRVVAWRELSEPWKGEQP